MLLAALFRINRILFISVLNLTSRWPGTTTTESSAYLETEPPFAYFTSSGDVARLSGEVFQDVTRTVRRKLQICCRFRAGISARTIRFQDKSSTNIRDLKAASIA
ncbi:hypothetical protein V3481_006894 [Fusarium oxysporum f. sp. vasinfectum]